MLYEHQTYRSPKPPANSGKSFMIGMIVIGLAVFVVDPFSFRELIFEGNSQRSDSVPQNNCPENAVPQMVLENGRLVEQPIDPECAIVTLFPTPSVTSDPLSFETDAQGIFKQTGEASIKNKLEAEYTIEIEAITPSEVREGGGLTYLTVLVDTKETVSERYTLVLQEQGPGLYSITAATKG
ncbi:DUF350 domain-containing protein [candidate division WWE3 bacterium]|uniref:DUF350 domain-containing protein n=1 Tax=candidate division WWE3 bacterium TaxID=2053526 RepID=A0A955LGS4_UNCKA|nr:DUF350 domain-containing protein [candidate division WWE3 bacterium]